MTYNVFSGTLNPTQSMWVRVMSWRCALYAHIYNTRVYFLPSVL